jgi:chromosome condensin MukBEF MukE localization factor
MPAHKTFQSNDSTELPYLKRIFDDLRRGKHLAEGDGPHVHALREDTEAYARLFDALGFTLVQHPRGFFFFAADPSSNVTDMAGRLAVFIFILVESLADQGKQVEETLMTHTFNVTALPHLSTDRFVTYMRDVGVTSLDELRQVLKNMRRLGFAELVGDDLFRFRTPAYRFLDLCSELAAEHEDAEPDSPTSVAKETIPGEEEAV